MYQETTSKTATPELLEKLITEPKSQMKNFTFMRLFQNVSERKLKKEYLTSSEATKHTTSQAPSSAPHLEKSLSILDIYTQ